MGHKSGLKHSGAKGKEEVLPILNAETLDAAQDGDEVDIKAMARRHAEMSMRTLVNAQRHKLTKKQRELGYTLAPWSVRTRSAKDVLELAGGRPETREAEQHEVGFTVIINQLSGGEPMTTIVSKATMEKEKALAIDATVVSD